MGSSKPSIDRALCLVLALCTTSAEAQSAPSVRVTVGPPHRSVEVRVEGSTLVVGDARVPFPLGRAPTAAPTVENVTVSGVKLALLRYREGTALVEALIGAGGVVHIGRADLHGDPGERTRQALTVVRERGVTLRREEEDERVRRCDGTRLVRTRVLDAASGRFVAVPQSGEPAGDALALTAGEGPERSLASLVRFSGADFEPSEAAPEGTRELALAFDGRPTTMVTMLGANALGRPTLVGRWEGGERYPLRALGFVPRPTGASSGPPTWVRVTLDARSFVVRFPSDATPGARYLARLPEGGARCITLEIGPPSSGASSTLGDIAFLASFDLDGDLTRVVDDLAVGGEAGTLAADVLSRAGDPAARLLAARFADMPAGERRLAVRVVARLAERSESARTVLGLALADRDETVQRAALEATRPLGAAGVELLAARIEAGDLALANELTRRAPGRSLSALLTRFTSADATQRATMRPLLVEAGRRAQPSDTTAALAALGTYEGEARADLGLVAAELPGGHDIARTIAESLANEADFVARRKALLIALALPARERGEALLDFATRSLEAEEWMIRADAIRVAGAPEAPRAIEQRLRMLEDPYPRVRVAAIDAGPLEEALVVPVARLARLDDWPLVRASGIAAIAGDARTRPIQRAAVRDRAERVRVAAITVLIANRDLGAYEQIEGRLTAPGEVPDVYRAALRYVRALCVREAVPAVADLLDRMSEDESRIDLAQEAALVLVALGTDEARSALARAPGNVRGPLDAPNAARPALCVPAEAP